MIKYAITDPSFFSPYTPYEYFNALRADYLLFRDKKTHHYCNDATIFIQKSRSYPFKKILHQDYMLAKELGADGVHLSSNQLDDTSKARSLGLFTIVSTHSFDEIAKAQQLGANAVTFSPIFDTPNKGKAKGVLVLREAVEKFDIKIIALGGIITKEHIAQLEYANPWGFASIRYFKI